MRRGSVRAAAVLCAALLSVTLAFAAAPNAGSAVPPDARRGTEQPGQLHVMILVIATSTTAEYALRAAYENTIGRASWLLDGARLTDEDRYGARTTQEYVDFTRQQPWYLFDFWSRLKHLWTDVPLWGPGLVRKWERRYALTTEYAIKAVYGELIEKVAGAAHTPAVFGLH